MPIPSSPYAISKVGTDLLGRYYAEAYGMVVMTTRMFTHTGPRRGDVFHESTFAKQIAMIEAGLIEPVVRVGNLKSLRTYADVRDTIKVVIDQERLRPIDADLQVPDCRKFKEHTGWEPKISFEETMFDLLEYWRNKIKKGKVFLTR